MTMTASRAAPARARRVVLLAPLRSDTFEERVTEHPIRLGRSVEVSNALVEARRVDQARRDRGLAYALDHRSERPSCESVDELGPARIHVDHPRRDTDRVEARLHHHRVDLPADQRVPPAARWSSIWHRMAACAAALSGWK